VQGPARISVTVLWVACCIRSRRYGDNFKGFYITQHQIKAGEIAGKSSNENWAVRCMKRYEHIAQQTHPAELMHLMPC
jgi:hypothetical protein